MTNDLTQADKSDLRKLEQQVDRCVKTFREAGNALREIRDRKLYRGEHKTFPDYLRARWSIGKSHAYRLIEAADFVETSPSGDEIETEGEARRAIAQQRQATADEHGDIPPDDPDEDAGEWDDAIDPGKPDDFTGPDPDEEPTPYEQFQMRLDGFCAAQMRCIADLTWPAMCSVMATAADEWHSREDR